MTEVTLPRPRRIKVPWAGLSVLGLLGILSAFATLVSNTFSVTVAENVSDWETQGASNCSDAYGSFDAFIPGLRGSAACTRGGFVPGTNVISVTNLSTSGSGSFSDALRSACPKVIIFDVAGHVDYGTTDDILENGGIEEGCDHASIVGASAPGQFAVTGGDMKAALKLGGGDVTMDHIVSTNHGRGSNVDNNGQSRDAVSTGWEQTGHEKKLILNSAIIWGWDEGFQCYDNDLYRVVGTQLWQSVIGLSGGYDPAELPSIVSHQFGHMNHWMCLQSANIRNVYMHEKSRSPFSRGDGLLHANNIIFNPGTQNLISQPCGSGVVPTYRVNVMNNYTIWGPDTSMALWRTADFQQAGCKTGEVSIYENGNAVQNGVTQAISNCTNHNCANLAANNNWATSPVPYAMPTGYVPESFDPSSDASLTAFANKILAHVGPRPTDRLAYIQSRVVDAVEAGLSGNVAGMGAPLVLEQTTMDDEGGFAVLNTNTGNWDASAQCPTHDGNPNNNTPAEYNAISTSGSGLTNLHEWVITCFYDNVMPAGYREAL